MRLKLFIIQLVLILGINIMFPLTILGQQLDSLRSYYFEKDDIVFQFDVRQYFPVGGERPTDIDFEDFKIDEVIVSGSFNEWNRDDWKMKKVSKFIYQLRKPIDALDDPFYLDFKFLINRDYWINPPEIDPQSLRTESDPFWEEVFEVEMYEIKPDSNGNASFHLSGWDHVREVVLTGEFNGWNEKQLKMTRVADGWSCKLDLDLGRYEYKFIADGEWLHDPANEEKVENEHGTYNSVLEVSKEVIFELKGFANAKKIELAGSFNNWQDRPNWFMEKTVDGWQYKINLIGGKHFYKFIVDGEWITDPENIMTEHDRDGYINSVLFVR